MPKNFPRAPPPLLAAALAPLAWAWGCPDLFDSYSAGVILMQVSAEQCCVFAVCFGALAATREAKGVRCPTRKRHSIWDMKSLRMVFTPAAWRSFHRAPMSPATSLPAAVGAAAKASGGAAQLPCGAVAVRLRPQPLAAVSSWGLVGCFRAMAGAMCSACRRACLAIAYPALPALGRPVASLASCQFGDLSCFYWSSIAGPRRAPAKWTFRCWMPTAARVSLLDCTV